MTESSRRMATVVALAASGLACGLRPLAATAPQQPESPKASVETTITRFDPDRKASPIHPAMTASASVSSGNVRVAGAVVSIDAKAGVYIRDPGSHYVWSYRIFAPGDEKRETPLFERIFTDRVVTPRPGIRTTTELRAAVEPRLPPGEYIGEIGITKFHDDFGMRHVLDRKQSQNELSASNRDKLTIRN